MWDWARHESVQHDSYLCERFPGTVPWPTKRLMGRMNNFVGAVTYNRVLGVTNRECPVACRPKEHPEWRFC